MSPRLRPRRGGRRLRQRRPTPTSSSPACGPTPCIATGATARSRTSPRPPGLAGDRDWPTSAAFADLDGDGDLDLYVCHYMALGSPTHPRALPRTTRAKLLLLRPAARSTPQPDHVFRNDGGRFVDVTARPGIADPDGRGLGVVAADLDGDGRVDLYVANDGTANYLFRNLGGFRFEEVGAVVGRGRQRRGRLPGRAWGSPAATSTATACPTWP